MTGFAALSNTLLVTSKGLLVLLLFLVESFYRFIVMISTLSNTAAEISDVRY